MKKAKAFTLIELLIAAGIFSIVLLSIYSAFHTGILSYQKVDASFEVFQNARMLFNRMDLDLSNAFGYTDKESRFQGNSSSMDFFSLLDYFLEDKSFIALNRIKYTFSADILKRSAYMGVEAMGKNIAPKDEEISSQIKEISFSYAGLTGKATEPYEWQDSWHKDQAQGGLMPEAVKVKLVLLQKEKRQGSERLVEFNKIISLLR